MNSDKKALILYVKFGVLKNILEEVKESYCNMIPEQVSDVQYMAAGNFLKRLINAKDTIETYFDDYLEFNSVNFEKELWDKIIKNISVKYNTAFKEEKDILSMLMEDFNSITQYIASLAKLSTQTVKYNSETQDEYVIV